MPRSLALAIQIGLVVALFLGSLAVLLINAFGSLVLPQRQAEIRNDLRTAGRRLAVAGEPLLGDLARSRPDRLDELDRRLHDRGLDVLAEFPGVEGGFYLADGQNRFSGAAFPTHGPGPRPPRRNEPPPLEMPYIRFQARQSVATGEEQFTEPDVPPSRVAIFTAPVGTDRPARAAVWTMFRITGPAQMEGQVSRYRLSIALALVGIALSLVLTANLVRILTRQRREGERLRDELRRAENLAALGKLLAGVAHEVRNPLAGIRSTVQLWERLPETARNPASLHAVIRAVDRLNDLVSRLLYFARADQAERQPVAVNRVVEETLKLVEAQAAGQGVVVETELADALPAVPGSAGALQQVFLNLAANALQAMPAGGRLRVRTHPSRDGRGVEVRFADTGPGIAPEDRPHLFEPFFTTRPEGTGLGLALCREIVSQHGGQIDWEPGAGPGAVFRVALPAAGS